MMKINDSIHGFRLLAMKEIAEADSVAYEFTHEKSGARLFFLQNDDDNKVFSIAFRTPPSDNTGVAHIVEHSTLCGSRKYPLKEPFVELIKGSLNTFLNAITFPDKTIYPVASRNDKDFQNLMDVYLDAVFYPAIYDTPEILMQEGWHYEIEKPEDPLTYSGVVYNEMKGALSSPDDLLETAITSSLYPDTTYSFESGGNPAAIPSLTQEMFAGFHKKFYHPSNSYIYLYGDMDLDQKLAYLDAEYLSHFERIPIPSEIDRQPMFSEMKRMVKEYPVGAEESTEEKTFLSLNMIVGEADDAETMLGLEILEHALLKTEAAPLRQALLDAKVGKDVYSMFEDAVLQPFFSIVANGAEPERADQFYEVVNGTLQKLVKDGLDRTLLEASINLLEFKLREADFGQYPKGLIYNFKIMNSWLYNADPAMFLYYEELIQKMKDGLDNGYFEKLIERCFLQNTHKTLLILKPSTEAAQKNAAKLEKELAEKKAAMSAAEIREIIATTKSLKERQQSEETPEALATIPILQLSDIQKQAETLPLEERSLGENKVLFSNVVTNKIVYLNLYFDASNVAQEKLPYAYLLTELLGAVDTKEHSYAELANLMNLNTGGIGYDLLAYTRKGETDSCLPKFKIKAKSLAKKLPELCSLLAEILVSSSFADKKRVQEILLQCRASMELQLLRSSRQIMATRLAAHLTAAGAYNEQGSLSFYWFVRELTDHFDDRYEELRAALQELLPVLFNRHSLMMSVTTEEKNYALFAGQMQEFLTQLPDELYLSSDYHWDSQKQKEGLLSSSRVQYVGKGANFLKLGYSFTGSMRVLETMLRYDYFWTKIRVQGGAYGASTQFNRNGVMLFTSYRDPNLAETVDVFDHTAEYIAEFAASEREMDKFIIGTISGIDTPLTPQMKGNLAAECWIRGVTQAERQQQRDEILATRQQDIRALAPLVDACMRENILCVFGNEVKIKENETMFDHLLNVME